MSDTAFIVLIMNANSLQLLIVRSIEIIQCLFWIVQCNCMKLSQLPIGPLLIHVHTLGNVATDIPPHTYLCPLCVCCYLSKGGYERHDIHYCNCHNETKHQINSITASFISSIYHSLSQSVHLCRLVGRDINVTFVKHGCS